MSAHSSDVYSGNFFVRRRVSFVPVGESRCKQSFSAACDMNRIVKSFFKSGTVSHLSSAPPRFADVSSMPDFKSAQDTVIRGRSVFSRLPSLVRERFRNDPGEFLKFAADPANAKELRGILGDPYKEPSVPSTEAPAGSGAPPQGGKPDKAPKAPKGASEAPSRPLPGIGEDA